MSVFGCHMKGSCMGADDVTIVCHYCVSSIGGGGGGGADDITIVCPVLGVGGGVLMMSLLCVQYWGGGGADDITIVCPVLGGGGRGC